MKIRYLENNTIKPSKFWAILINEDTQLIKFGKIGNTGKELVKKFKSKEESQKKFESLINKKIKIGYKKITSSKNKEFVIDRLRVVFEVQESLKRFNLHKFLGNLEIYSERGIKIKTVKPDKYENVGNSRIGGVPDLPKNMDWPLTVYGQYFNFLSQINLRDIAHLNFNLPNEGILYFFMGEDAGVEEDNKVIYYSGNLTELKKYNIKNLSDKGFADGECEYMKRPYILNFEEIISMANVLDLPEELEISKLSCY